jgi:hypothetical protein
VFSKVKARCNSLELGNCSKLVAHYCGTFEILERISPVAYMLASLCINNVFHVSLLKTYVPDANNIIDWNLIQVEKEGDFRVRPVCIVHWKIKQLQNRVVELVKVQWTCNGPKDETWECMDSMREEYPHILKFLEVLYVHVYIMH